MEDANLKRSREDLQNRIDILQKQAEVSSRYFTFFTFFPDFLLLLICDLFCFRALMTRDLSLMLLCGMMEKYGGLLLTHRVLRMILIVGNLLSLYR